MLNLSLAVKNFAKIGKKSEKSVYGGKFLVIMT